ncbi:MAG: aminotransferase class V-fold PLP-dependent enzyme [Oscillospiraceae bacterium]|nr:aminotransferase class V-fold PLP-dependent enzyme [Oscillospiraceae bacterium]
MLYDKLKEYNKSGIYPMHMPGHKRNGEFMPAGLPYDIDITEIQGFDDLHNQQGVLLEASKLAAELYGSREAFLLVNGTTVGILAAIGAHTKQGDKILAVSNCHWSTTNAAKLFGLEIVMLDCTVDSKTGVPCSVSPPAIEAALDKNPDIKMVVITSPTYEGVVCDIESIAGITHHNGAILLVDAAHGAHLGFSDFLPQSSITAGADIVVLSIHKTLPALTQCSLLHVCSQRIDVNAIKEMLYILQTSSPSYVLMASIDYCLRLIKSDSIKLFREYKQNLEQFYSDARNVKNLSLLYSLYGGKENQNRDFYTLDPGKIVIITKGTAINSAGLTDILRNRFKIEIERVYDDYIIALTSICDTKEGFKRLAAALCEIDTGL